MTNVSTYGDICLKHARHINNVREVSQMIHRSIEHSRRKGWRSVSVPYADALAAVDVLDESANATESMFVSSIRALKISDRNSEVVDRIILQPLQIVVNAYRDGKVTEQTMADAIKNFLTFKCDAV